MKAGESLARAEQPIVFRAGAGALVVWAFLVTLVAYFPLKLWTTLPYPFAAAVVIGLAGGVLFWIGWRRQGIEAGAAGLRDLASGARIGWKEIDRIQIDVTAARPGQSAPPARVVTIASADGRSIRFADISSPLPRGAGWPLIENAPLLLALIADRTGSEALYPTRWHEAAPAAAAEECAPPPRVPLLMRLRRAWAVVPLVLKLAKSIKPAWLIASFGLYSLIFSWEFAAVLLVLIGFHECGHVFAMYRCGIPVKGIYFIPFLGGAAVSKGLARTRREEAYIAANGPVWGTLLVCVCFAAYVLSDGRYPILAAAGALINLFNLLPILPLDGGRLLSDVAYSLSHGAGNVAVCASLLLGGALAYFSGLELLVLMVLIGVFEYLSHQSIRPLGLAVQALAPRRRLGFEEHDHFSSLIRPTQLGAGTARQLESRRREFDVRLHQARMTPMSAAQTTLILAIYALLVVVLIGIMYLTADLPGHIDPLELLR